MDSILTFVDFSDVTPSLLRVSQQMAQRFGMKVFLVHVATPDSDYEAGGLRDDVSRQGISAEMHRNHHMLQIVETESAKLGVEVSALLVRARSSRGNPVPKMLREVKRLKPALIIMGTHGHGRLYEALLGSASSAVVRSATCPVLLVPTRQPLRAWSTLKGKVSPAPPSSSEDPSPGQKRASRPPGSGSRR